jgi:galactokinase
VPHATESRAAFARAFGGDPTVIVSAPGRVNLIGEHTDYNGGEVLPMAIDRRTYVAGRRTGAEWTRVASAEHSVRGAFDPHSPDRAGSWWDYIAGVTWELGLLGRRPEAMDLAVWSDVPTGAGLSSSAALEVATALAVLELTNQTMDARELALAAWRAEVEFVGVSVGIMDQFASALSRRGEALHIWCDTGRVAYTRMPDAVLIFDTAVPRSLRGSAYAARRAECEEALAHLKRRYPDLPNIASADPAQLTDAALPPPLARRARHVVTENRRVQAAVAALDSGAPLPGDLLLASHASLRDDYECSSPELDWFVERVMAEPGVRGARLTGAGWGGCAIAIGDEEALLAAAAPVAAAFVHRFGREPRTWISRGAEGMRVDAGVALPVCRQ